MNSHRMILLGVALLTAVFTPALAADAMMSLDDYNIRRAIILQCHMTQNAVDIAFLARGEALRRTALAELRLSVAGRQALGRLGLARVVVEHGAQPAFGLLESPALAAGVILDLVALDFPDPEVTRLGMAEI